mmetsp:Transcript_9071/g.25558  ORF Transcript_9071/g.25558 Transcript_9071/m.25558 type:complete len:250 (+) Transcript_9071:62-811(+)|eukprot:CAMPEP_0179276282 /NCGR_PEP_ID=MMETSP0797-20121207/34497_1 /TAXON_ID=47934 /ORGANISM="Dinophysis acuminata, Strain DAEP01" /LENGTH=249 /DNA_ID=CAMNT_0020984833 /DNA_START=31 /DNA_END=780 /DNA_ORIENTATION=+
MGSGISSEQLAENARLSRLHEHASAPHRHLVPGLHEAWYRPKNKLLILQSAGNVTHEGGTAEAEDIQAESYLTGSAINVGIVQNHFIEHGLPQANITIENFSVCNEKDPRMVIQDFIRSCHHHGNDMMIYYTGHGDATGAWRFTLHSRNKREVLVSPGDMREWVHAHDRPGQMPWLMIMSQSCYSGKWVEQAWDTFRSRTAVYSSASSTEQSFSTPRGSEWTKFKFGCGKKHSGRSSPQFCYKPRVKLA